MKPLLYGVWDEKMYDFRHAPHNGDGEIPSIAAEADWPQATSTYAFIADRGFLVFDEATHLSAAFWRYVQHAAQASCGKCTPCRVGTSELRQRLELALRGELAQEDLAQMRQLAAHIGATSLCGLGKSCCRALLGALTHFPDELVRRPPEHQAQHSQLYLTAPCIEACPSKVDVPRYLDHIKDEQPLHALGVILEKYPIAATCGRVCVRYCETACRRNFAEGALAIKMLKRYAADAAQLQQVGLFSRDLVQPGVVAGARVAVVGAGPAGITCAYHLLLQGVQVTIFEAHDEAGGMAVAGIPSYRLPKHIVKTETEEAILALGGEFRFNQRLGTDFQINDLFAQGFEAVFLGLGATRGSLLGEHDEPTLNGYLSGIDFLWQVHCHVEDGVTMSLPGDVVVVGGGNVAMDCVRSAVRLGAKNVHLVYRRTVADMPAEEEEILAAQAEGVIFHCLTNPTRILSEADHVIGIELTRMRQSSGDRRRVEAEAGTEFTLDCATVIAAIGQRVDTSCFCDDDGVAHEKNGTVAVNPQSLVTTRPGVFAGGDCVLGPQTLIQAMDHGEQAAHSIVHYLRGLTPHPSATQQLQRFLAAKRLLADEKVRRPLIPQQRAASHEIGIHARLGSFDEVEMPISADAARREAERCLRCYRLYSLVSEGAP